MIIGIYGKAGHGKDTVAAMIQEITSNKSVTVERHKIKRDFTAPFETVKFAGKLKEVCATLTGMPVHVFYNRENYNTVIPQFGVTARELMQKVGTALKEHIADDIWVKSALWKIRPNQNVLITDLRYPVEATAIRQAGGFMVKIVRPDHIDETLTSEETRNHSSENALNSYKDFDAEILNDSDLIALRVKVKQMLERLQII